MWEECGDEVYCFAQKPIMQDTGTGYE